MSNSNKIYLNEFDEEDIEKFEGLFDKKNRNICWIWSGATDRDGYGDFSANKKKYKAHRVSYVIHNKCNIEQGLLILHSCDNPPCVNPNHLSIGTEQDNSDDMISKNRQALGIKNFKAKLNENLVLEILELYYFKNKSILELEDKFYISNTMISNIVNGKFWINAYNSFMNKNNYPSKPNCNLDGRRSGEKNGRAILKEVDVLEVLNMFYIKHKSRKDIAEYFKIGRYVVELIVVGKTWKNTYNKFMKLYGI